MAKKMGICCPKMLHRVRSMSEAVANSTALVIAKIKELDEARRQRAEGEQQESRVDTGK